MTVEAGHSYNYKQICLWSLVLQSVGVSHMVANRGSGWVITVAEDLEEVASHQLASFEEENTRWPPPAPENHRSLFSFHRRRPPTIFLMSFFLFFFALTGSWSVDPWFEAGAVNSVQIMEHGQWWRLVTGLTLHADPVHLVGNLIIGGLMVHLVCKTVGSGCGWLAILLAGSLGNLINILARDSFHLSVGFSTAVFGSIGILSGIAIRRQGRIRDMLPPLGAGLALLAMLGMEGARTDIGAHVSGLACGGIFGFLLAGFPRILEDRDSVLVQAVSFACALLLVSGCWWLALMDI